MDDDVLVLSRGRDQATIDAFERFPRLGFVAMNVVLSISKGTYIRIREIKLAESLSIRIVSMCSLLRKRCCILCCKKRSS
jgi:hypothetical protein